MKKLYRLRDDRTLGGVISGIGQYFQLDPNLLRVGVVLACFLTAFFPIAITYFVAWAIVPEEPLIMSAISEPQTIGDTELAAE